METCYCKQFGRCYSSQHLIYYSFVTCRMDFSAGLVRCSFVARFDRLWGCGCHCVRRLSWMKLYPDKNVGSRDVDSVGLANDVPDKGMIQPFSKAAKSELVPHRNQGHTPHNPNCLECARGRTTFKHRRRAGDLIESEIQADFGFISQHGEVSESESPGAIKVFVMPEMVSNSIAYVVVGEDTSKVRSQITKWLLHFGLESERISIILHTDAEQAVRNLVTSSSSRFSFQVRKSGNQQHQSIGGARRMKESLAILRADLMEHGWDVRMSTEHLGEGLTYLALMHNHFGRSREMDMIPLEMISGRRLSKTALFGSTVLAEIPTSLKKYVPNEARSIEASFLHPGVDHGPVVQGVRRIDDELQLVQFCARNVRTITPISWKRRLCDSFWGRWVFSFKMKTKNLFRFEINQSPSLVRMIPYQTSLRLMETFPSNWPLSLLTIPLKEYTVRMQIVVMNVHYHKSWCPCLFGQKHHGPGCLLSCCPGGWTHETSHPSCCLAVVWEVSAIVDIPTCLPSPESLRTPAQSSNALSVAWSKSFLTKKHKAQPVANATATNARVQAWIGADCDSLVVWFPGNLAPRVLEGIVKRTKDYRNQHAAPRPLYC